LQESRFTAVDLADLAHSLDEQERRAMLEGNPEDYERFIAEPSGNLDDSGYFSVQVIEKALEFCGLELVPYASNDPRAVAARAYPP
jgi:ataxin-3